MSTAASAATASLKGCEPACLLPGSLPVYALHATGLWSNVLGLELETAAGICAAHAAMGVAFHFCLISLLRG